MVPSLRSAPVTVLAAAVAVVAAAVGLGGCGSTSVSVEPGAAAMASKVAAIAELPVGLGYGDAGDQRRVQRRTADALIALASGRAIIADELLGALPPRSADAMDLTDQEISQSVRALGEVPDHVLTFAIVASRARRGIVNTSPIPGFQLGRRIVMDYRVRIEVRQAGRADVLGTTDTVAVSELNVGEVGPRGESLGVQKAIDEALARAVRTFAPGLATKVGDAAPPMIAEVPAVAQDGLKRLQALQELYPELSLDEMQAFTTTGQRFMVIRPGGLATLGLAPGDLFGPAEGQTLGSRAALVRTVARGGSVRLVVERAGQKYLLAQQ